MVLRTDGIAMRPVVEGDAESLIGVCRHAQVRRYLLDDRLVSLEWVNDEIASSVEQLAVLGAGLWAIEVADGSRSVGFVGFREFFDPPRLVVFVRCA